MRTFSNRVGLLALLACLAGCQPSASTVTAGSFGLDRDELGNPIATAGSAAPGTPAAPPAPGLVAAPVAAAVGAGVHTDAGDRSAYVEAAGSAWDPAGISLPAYSGEVTLLLEGAVPMSLHVPGVAVVVHPRPAGGLPTPAGQATVSGTVSPASAGLSVQYLSPGRRAFAGGITDASGHFSFSVPLDAPEDGLVLARTVETTPSLAVTRIGLAPDAAVTAGALALVAPTYPAPYRVAGLGDADPAGAPPAGLYGTGTDIVLLEAGPWRAPVASLGAGASEPAYALPGFTPAIAFSAASPDGRRASELVSTGAPRAWLAPPALEGLPSTLSPNTELRWAAVPGARLYTVSLSLPGAEDTPVWEGLCATSAIALPGRLTLAATQAIVRVDAWDDTEVSAFSIASARAFRIPDGPLSAGGRHSWSRRTVAFTPRS